MIAAFASPATRSDAVRALAVLILACFLSATAQAQQRAVPPPEQPGSGVEVAPPAAGGDPPGEAPADLEPFRPSEEIEEDMSVAFPVDI